MMHMTLVFGLSACLLIVFGTTDASATTWYVASDGSGQYEIIQDAVNASAPGDTIRIAPGRYDTFRLFNSPIGESLNVVSLPHDLVLLGAGQENTFIGPAEYSPVVDDRATTGVWGRSPIAAAVVEDLTVENMMNGFYFGGELTLRDVTIRGMRATFVFLSFSDGLTIERCTLVDDTDPVFRASIVHTLSGQLVPFIRITESVLIGGNPISLVNTANVLIEDCDFVDVTTAMVWWGQGDIVVENCRISGDQLHTAISIDGPSVTLRDTEIGPSHLRSLFLGFGSNVTATRVSLAGGESETIWVEGSSSLTIRDSDILRTDGWFVQAAGGTSIDLRNNWWGTTDRDYIDEWIFDRNDCTEECSLGEVQIDPILLNSVDSKKTSFGEFRARFGQ